MLGDAPADRSALNFRNYLLSAFDPADRDALIPDLTEVSLSAGQVLYRPGERVDGVYFPSTAVISVATLMSDGQIVETGAVGFESAIGVLAALSGDPMRSQVFVQMPGAAMRLPAAALQRQALDSPGLIKLLLRHAQADVAQAELMAACNALHAAAPRLARWLLMTSDRTGSAVMALTQEDMSLMLGVQRTTISAAANQLRDRRLISYSRGQLRILNREGLIAAACECYGVRLEAFRGLTPMEQG
jgi:CRP-like cAMP-binding protein